MKVADKSLIVCTLRKPANRVREILGFINMGFNMIEDSGGSEGAFNFGRYDCRQRISELVEFFDVR